MAQGDKADRVAMSGRGSSHVSRSKGRGHTSIWKRTGELLHTSLRVWLAAAAVNAVTQLTNAARGPLVAFEAAAVTLGVATLAAWAAGRIEIGWDRVAFKRGRVSLRRVAALGLAVIIASIATTGIVWLVSSIVSTLQAPSGPRAIQGN